MRNRTILLLCVMLAPVLCSAQLGTGGSILGIVQDESGAVVPGASVAVSNTETGLKNAVVTDEGGYFQVMALPPGTYSVQVSLQGFKTWQFNDATLTSGENKRLAPVLQVGGMQEQVTVTAGIELVQTERGSVETAIEQKQIRELPLNGRAAVEMVALTPGMRYLGVTQANTLGVKAQGMGQHSDATEFAVDGMSTNDPSVEAGMAFPNLDSVDQFRVQTSSFTAENGRQPIQVTMITKSGTNQYHGTLWEFLRNDALDARNTFAPNKPVLRRNQYGFSAGGPIIKDRTFLFASFEGLKIRTQQIYNSTTIAPAFLQGDFSSLTKAINDPATGKPFPGNLIPVSRFSAASKFFFPYILLPNAPGNKFQALASVPEDNTNLMFRVDHQLNASQKFYARWIRVGDGQTNSGYRPDVVSTTDLVQHNSALNYEWTVKPWMLFAITGGFVHSNFQGDSPLIGKENLTDQAGIQGFPTALRAGAIGLPSVAFTGYAGFAWPQQLPSSFKREVIHGRSSLNIIRGAHTLAVGFEYLDQRTGVAHSSANPRGNFTFNSQYTGDGFADYLLGLVQAAAANAPLALFGMAHSPYSGLYADETWRVSPNLTLNAGVRWDYWWHKTFVRGTGTTFDDTIGKAVAGENSRGEVDLTAQPVSPYFAAATKDLWITATQAGMDKGLFKHSGYVSPRIGAAWRPFGNSSLVVRAGYGIFASSYNGNSTASSIIGPPYWANQNISFAKASNQRWETAFPADPANFVAPSVAAPVYGIKPMKTHQFNVSIQKTIPWLQAAGTISYVGSRGWDLTAQPRTNTPAPGKYTNLQAARPYPQFGNINLYKSIGKEWYNSLQAKLERRFGQGLMYTFSYTFSRDISLWGADTVYQPTLYAPENYDRGSSPNERRHILSASGIYELPYGRGKRFGGNMPGVVNAILGGWQFSGMYRFVAGAPLTLVVPGATLGNGVNARPDVVGDWKLENPSPERWFNPDAFAKPAPYVFGNSAIGAIVGPAFHELDTGLMKNFDFAEGKRLQFRWEMFNALNEVNLGDPVVNIGLATTGLITSAGDARQMQFGLKFLF